MIRSHNLRHLEHSVGAADFQVSEKWSNGSRNLYFFEAESDPGSDCQMPLGNFIIPLPKSTHRIEIKQLNSEMGFFLQWLMQLLMKYLSIMRRKMHWDHADRGSELDTEIHKCVALTYMSYMVGTQRTDVLIFFPWKIAEIRTTRVGRRYVAHAATVHLKAGCSSIIETHCRPSSTGRWLCKPCYYSFRSCLGDVEGSSGTVKHTGVPRRNAERENTTPFFLPFQVKIQLCFFYVFPPSCPLFCWGMISSQKNYVLWTF